MDDIFDDDIETGETMIALPRNWTRLTLEDINDGKSRLVRTQPRLSTKLMD